MRNVIGTIKRMFLYAFSQKFKIILGKKVLESNLMVSLFRNVSVNRPLEKVKTGLKKGQHLHKNGFNLRNIIT